MAKKNEKSAAEGKRYTPAAIMRDQRFSHVQKDFLKVILDKPFYTMEEAGQAVSHFFEKE